MSKDPPRDADPEVAKDLLARSREPGGEVYAVAGALLRLRNGQDDQAVQIANAIHTLADAVGRLADILA
jgi:hypothetical protein